MAATMAAELNKMAADMMLINGTRTDLLNREELIEKFKNSPANYVVFAGKKTF